MARRHKGSKSNQDPDPEESIHKVTKTIKKAKPAKNDENNLIGIAQAIVGETALLPVESIKSKKGTPKRKTSAISEARDNQQEHLPKSIIEELKVKMGETEVSTADLNEPKASMLEGQKSSQSSKEHVSLDQKKSKKKSKSKRLADDESQGELLEASKPLALETEPKEINPPPKKLKAKTKKVKKQECDPSSTADDVQGELLEASKPPVLETEPKEINPPPKKLKAKTKKVKKQDGDPIPTADNSQGEIMEASKPLESETEPSETPKKILKAKTKKVKKQDGAPISTANEVQGEIIEASKPLESETEPSETPKKILKAKTKKVKKQDGAPISTANEVQGELNETSKPLEVESEVNEKPKKEQKAKSKKVKKLDDSISQQVCILQEVVVEEDSSKKKNKKTKVAKETNDPPSKIKKKKKASPNDDVENMNATLCDQGEIKTKKIKKLEKQAERDILSEVSSKSNIEVNVTSEEKKGKRKAKSVDEDLASVDKKKRKEKKSKVEDKTEAEVQERKETSGLEATPEAVKGKNQWEQVSLGSAKRTDKFLRLMGAKKNAGSEGAPSKVQPALSQDKSKELQKNLQSQFDASMKINQQRKKGQRKGLGA